MARPSLPPLKDHERYQLNVISMLVEKLGGEVVVNDKEMQELWSNTDLKHKQIYDADNGLWIWKSKEGS